MHRTGRGCASFTWAAASDACQSQDCDRDAEEEGHDDDRYPGVAVPAVTLGTAEEDKIERIG